ncbi:hypothetical protein CEXT_30871 [Caerostris extrusa]|uniref:Uncharacterized protein n=1 Tax=Caerostris extrusa TaxID=172846 RepID=A0AAV4XR03_CAEEX|nr:hypothetical protein CEXT_30871 [Caerostris extrusa]
MEKFIAPRKLAKDFERNTLPTCYICHSNRHYRPNCSQLKKEKLIEFVNQEIDSPVVKCVLELINRMKRYHDLEIQKMTEVQAKRKGWYEKMQSNENLKSETKF